MPESSLLLIESHGIRIYHKSVAVGGRKLLQNENATVMTCRCILLVLVSNCETQRQKFATARMPDC